MSDGATLFLLLLFHAWGIVNGIYLERGLVRRRGALKRGLPDPPPSRSEP